MTEKQNQNRNYLIERLYPEYSFSRKQLKNSQVKNDSDGKKIMPVRAHRVMTEQDHKIDEKMKMVLYRLDRDLEQELVLKGKNKKNRKRAQTLDDSAVGHTHNSPKSTSHTNNETNKDPYKDRKKFKNRQRSMSEKQYKVQHSKPRKTSSTEAIKQQEQEKRQQLIRRLMKKKMKMHSQSERNSIQKNNYDGYQMLRRQEKGLKSAATERVDNRQAVQESVSLPKIGRNREINDKTGHKEKRMKKIDLLLQMSAEEDTKLGRLILEKVQKHFDMEKEFANDGKKQKLRYLEYVKSGEDIDETFVDSLRNKVKQANLTIMQKQKTAK